MEFFADNIAVLSLVALAIAIIITIWFDTNLGTLALGLSFLIAFVLGDWSAGDIVRQYPTNLFILLAGVTYFFGIANANGTMEKICKYAIKSVRGNVALLPIVLFFVAFVVSSIGPGQVSTAALFAAPVMALALETKIPLLLMALVVGNGAQAGAMSPIAPNGIVGNGVIAGLNWGEGALAGMTAPDWAMPMWINMLIVHVAVAAIAYFVCGGLKLWKRGKENPGELQSLKNIVVEPFTTKQKITLVAILVFIVLVIWQNWHLGLTGFFLGSILIIARIGDEKAAIKTMPWGAILLVTGVTVLVNLMSEIGGMDLFAELMAVQSNPTTVTLIAGFWSGLISAYASTSGVIMPAFLPMAPLLLERIGAAMTDLLPLVTSIVVAGHLTDMSPLSTTGAVFISGCPDSVDRKPLYRGMIVWGMSMAVIGAVACWVLFGMLRINV
jgi:di/tricarboxylate transporter